MVKTPRNRRGRVKRDEPVLYVGEWIRALGTTQTAVCRALKLNEGYLSEICNHRKTPGIGVLFELADHLKVKVDTFRKPPPSRQFITEATDLDPAILVRLRTQLPSESIKS